MSGNEDGARIAPKAWTSHAARMLGMSESVVLVLIGVSLVLVAALLLYSGMHDLNEAVHRGPKEIEHKSIEILNTVLLVMMTMEIVYTVAISLESRSQARSGSFATARTTTSRRGTSR
jgi:hypothetical protein